MANGKPDIAKEILDARTSSDAKRLSKFVPTSKNWEKESVKLMTEIVEAKFNQVEKAREAY